MAHITFIHGMANKPASEDLEAIWLRALSRSNPPIDLVSEGVSTSMVYWADVMYKEPISEAEYEATAGINVEDAISLSALTTSAKTQEEVNWIMSLSGKLIEPELSNTRLSVNLPNEGFEAIPLPKVVKNAFMRIFLRDVYYYLFNVEFSPRNGYVYKVQDEIRGRFLNGLERQNTRSKPHIIVAHSMGAIVAYDCLKRISSCPSIDAFVTLGCPLGIDEIQAKLVPGWSSNDGYPDNIRKNWINIYDPIDVVSFLKQRIAGDYLREGRAIVIDLPQENDGLWTHSVRKYLEGSVVGNAIAQILKA